MTSYAYRAAHATGRIHKGEMAAANENELAFHLRQLDLELIEAKKVRGFSFPSRSSKIRTSALIGLCSQMEDLLRAGLPFDEALAMVRETLSPGNPLAARLMTAAQALRAGGSVRASFAASLFSFDPVFLALLESGEKSGDLAETFARLARQLRWQDNLRRALSRALRYPLFLLAVVFGVTSFMMALVVPELASFLQSLGGELPFATRLLLRLAGWFEMFWWLAPCLFLMGGTILWAGRKTSLSFIEFSDKWFLALPFLGDVLRKLALARFATSLIALVKSGLSLQGAIGVAAGTFGNRFLETQAREAAAALSNGKSFSQATSLLFPPLVLQTVRVGEKSGALTRALEDVGRAYEKDAQESVASFLGALEPALTALVGAFLAWIVLAVLGPVYGSLGPLAGGI